MDSIWNSFGKAGGIRPFPVHIPPPHVGDFRLARIHRQVVVNLIAIRHDMPEANTAERLGVLERTLEARHQRRHDERGNEAVR